MAKSPKAAERRKMLMKIKELKARLGTVASWWSVAGTVYVEPADRVPGENYLRDREPSEYPEMQERYWAGTVREIDAMQAIFAEMRAHAVEQWHATERGV